MTVTGGSGGRVRARYTFNRALTQLGSLSEHRFDASLFATACFDATMYTSPGGFNYTHGYLSAPAITVTRGNVVEFSSQSGISPWSGRTFGEKAAADAPWRRSYIPCLITRRRRRNGFAARVPSVDATLSVAIVLKALRSDRSLLSARLCTYVFSGKSKRRPPLGTPPEERSR